jgi:hypothetical protein
VRVLSINRTLWAVFAFTITFEKSFIPGILANRRGFYILTNALTDLDEKVLDWSEREAAQMGITLAILGMLFMSNGKVC